jgi:hypothetical protein
MTKPGRPRKEIQLEQLKALMRLNPTLKDTAAFFECSEDTIERLIKAEFEGINFAEFREQNMVHTRMALIRNALKMAEKGNPAMMIFCLKNLCGWKDRFENEVITGSDNKKLIIQFEEKKDATKKGL